MKNIFIIGLILLFPAILFLGIYNIAFKKNPAQTKEPAVVNSENNSKENNSFKMEKIKAIVDEAVIAPVFDDEKEKIKYYLKKDGTAWETDSDGFGKDEISVKSLSEFKDAKWSPSRNMVISNVGGKFYFYNYVKKEGVELKKGLDAVVWDNLGAKIIYKYYDEKTKKRTLNIANPDGSEWKELANLPYKYVSMANIPQTSLISFWNFPDAQEQTILQTVGFMGGETRTIFTGKFGADYLWAPDGKKALMSSLSDQGSNNITLGIVKENGEYKNLGVQTFVSKCVWAKDGQNVYCGVPENLPQSAKLPNDYLSKNIVTKDSFWKINVETGEKKLVMEKEKINGSYDAANVFLSKTEDALFFVNRNDEKLYKVEL